MKSDPKLILLSAGGTGGHMTPAAAVAHDLLSRGYQVAIATDKRGTKYKHLFDDKVMFHVLSAGTLGAGIFGKIKGIGALGIGMVQARALVEKLRPAVVVGFGGYPSFPPVHAAQHHRVKTVIHQSDAVMGKANAMLAPKADRIALSFQKVQGLDEVDMVRAVVTGNPVREEFAALYSKPYPTLEMDGPMRIAVFGGSLGARVLSEITPHALAQLPMSYKERLHVTQQCRPEDLENVRKIYDEAGIKARLESFFDDVAGILEETHLVISRAGASTVAELTTAGRPAILVPAPYHKDNQQKINADVVADAGGAWVMTQDGFTAEALMTRVETFMQNPETLFRAAENARSCAKPDAARRLGNLVTAIAAGWDKDASRPFDLTQGRRG